MDRLIAAQREQMRNRAFPTNLTNDGGVRFTLENAPESSQAQASERSDPGITMDGITQIASPARDVTAPWRPKTRNIAKHA